MHRNSVFFKSYANIKGFGIGQDILIPYKKLEFESNMRLICLFASPITNQQVSAVPRK